MITTEVAPYDEDWFMLDRLRRQQSDATKRMRFGDCDCSDCDLSGCDSVPCDFNLTLLGLVASATPGRSRRPDVTVPAWLGVAAIRGYRRWLSPRLPIRCRHVPSCSAYGMEAVRRYGLYTGGRLTAARIQRCNPSRPRGTSDPVP